MLRRKQRRAEPGVPGGACKLRWEAKEQLRLEDDTDPTLRNKGVNTETARGRAFQEMANPEALMEEHPGVCFGKRGLQCGWSTRGQHGVGDLTRQALGLLSK